MTQKLQSEIEMRDTILYLLLHTTLYHVSSISLVKLYHKKINM